MELSEAISKLEPKPAVYLLNSKAGDYVYKGACRDLQKRMLDHKAGRVSRTKNKRPLRLIYYEYTEDYSCALKREKFFKSGAGREWISSSLLNQ